MTLAKRSRRNVVSRFFSFMGRCLTALRTFLVNTIFLIFLIFLLVGIFSKDVTTVENDVALVINPTGVLVDQLSYVDPMAYLVKGASTLPEETLLRDVTKAILAAAEDSRIKAIVMQLDDLQYGGVSKMHEIAEAIQQFKLSGKKVYIYGDSFTQDHYLLAAHADEIFLHPMGEVGLTGFGVYRNYFREALDNLKIDFHVFRVGEYKSAVEPFLRNDMSPEDREANRVWLNSLWQHYVQMIATARQIQPESVEDYINHIDRVLADSQGSSAQAALKSGFVTAIKSREEVNQFWLAEFGENREGHFRSIEFRDYVNSGIQPSVSPNKIGLIVASGTIVDGDEPPGVVAGDTVAQLIRDAINDDAIKAVVLRVDSEGGSAFASEVIREQLAVLRDAGKPLIVSMGSVAASGGYWISAGADEIWATPTTLTGSIGIFGVLPTFEKTLKRVGVSTDGVGTTELAGSLRVDRDLSPLAKRAIQQSVEYGYQQFIDLVAKGRHLELSYVESIAQGRVWSGADAKTIRLVDHLGGLNAAIAAAAERASLDDYVVVEMETTLDATQMLVKELFQSRVMQAVLDLFKGFSASNSLQIMVSALQKELAPLMQFNDPKNLYLYCSSCQKP